MQNIEIEVKVEVFYKTCMDGPIYDYYDTVPLGKEDIERLRKAGRYEPSLDDIYEKIEEVVGPEVNETITLNDGLWYYDFTEAFANYNEVFSIFDTEDTGYSMKIIVDYDSLGD